MFLGMALVCCLPALLACSPVSREVGKAQAIRQERFVALEGMAIYIAALPEEPEQMAAARLAKEVRRMAGITLRIVSGGVPQGPGILLGNRASLQPWLARTGFRLSAASGDQERVRQSYMVTRVNGGGTKPSLLALGLGTDRSAKAHLGTGYAVGELLRRLDTQRGRWGFRMPVKPVQASPATPHRTLYLMNSNARNPGLSLEHFTEEQIADYVDRVVEARFSRICFFQWSDFYLYPGNAPHARTDSQHIHRTMRTLLDRARRRGLEVYQMLSPAHANADTLPAERRFRATGYYGHTSICWSQPEARDLAKKMAQLEMEYYGPMDGYIVCFYDPGGCFCEECAAHQSERIFDQLTSVVEAAKTISPGAAFQASLWPTWGFTREPASIGYPGRGYNEADVRALVTGFLGRCLERFGPRGLTILDSCEADETNIYNGFVKPQEFKRSGFLYTVLGMASELHYPFAPFRLAYLADQLGKARHRGVEEAQIFIQYAATNYPGIFAFADFLYETSTGWRETANRIAATVAKGEAHGLYVRILAAMEDLVRAEDVRQAESAIQQMERCEKALRESPHYFGDKDWLRGYVMAQRNYHALAQARDDRAFDERMSRFRALLAELPMYQDFAKRTLDARLARLHVKQYWTASTRKSDLPRHP